MNERKIFDYARETDTVLIINGSEGSVDKNFFYLSGIEGGVIPHIHFMGERRWNLT